MGFKPRTFASNRGMENALTIKLLVIFHSMFLIVNSILTSLLESRAIVNTCG